MSKFKLQDTVLQFKHLGNNTPSILLSDISAIKPVLPRNFLTTETKNCWDIDILLKGGHSVKILINNQETYDSVFKSINTMFKWFNEGPDITEVV